jgi:uncharacterized membrane protein
METKTKRNIVIWAIIVLVLLNISSLGTIWYHRYQFKKVRQTERQDRRFDGRRPSENRRMGQIPPFMLKGMALSAEQKADLDSTWRYFNSKRRVLEDSMNSNRRRMFDIMMNETLDTGLYEVLSAKQSGIMRELNDTMLKMNRTMRTNLTEEQQKVLSDNMQRIKNRMPHERRQRVRK